MRAQLNVSSLLLLVIATACGGGSDSSGSPDAFVPDAFVPDALVPDATASDGDSGTHDAGLDSSLPEPCVAKTCDDIYDDGIANPYEACTNIDDGCGGTIDCACESRDYCGNDGLCGCVEYSVSELCQIAQSCGLVDVVGRCGTKKVSCSDPLQGSAVDSCDGTRCGTFPVDGEWCSWTRTCSCNAGDVCDAGACTGLRDARDDKTYPIVRIGNQIWMAKNLEYAAPGSECVSSGYDPTGCWRWGRYYTASGARAGASASDSNPSHVQGVCPAGFHLPSADEFEQLFAYVRELRDTEVGKHLKNSAISGLIAWTPADGLDSFGFNWLPAGERWSSTGSATSLNTSGRFWTASQSGGLPRSYILGATGNPYAIDNDTGLMLSVRCVRD